MSEYITVTAADVAALAAQKARRKIEAAHAQQQAARIRAATAAQQRADEDRAIARRWERGDRVGALAELVGVLCRRHSIRIEWIRDPRQGAAWPRGRLVKIAPVRDEYSGAVALHEIAHVLAGATPLSKLADEAFAWRVAERLVPASVFSMKMHEAVRAGLHSYLRCHRGDLATDIAVEMTSSRMCAERLLARQRFRDLEMKQGRVQHEIERTR